MVTPPGLGQTVQPITPYSEQTARIIREAILAGHYQPGQRLNEVELSTTLRISRSPIREGLRKLVDEGLVVLQPGRGAFVASFAAEEIAELLEFREALDVMAARLAAQRASAEQMEAMQRSLEAATVAHKSHDGVAPPWTSDFHILILKAGGNRKIVERGSEVHTQLHLARFRSGSTNHRPDEANEEHQAILDAIRARDPDAAEAAMRRHVRNAAAHITRVIAKGGA